MTTNSHAAPWTWSRVLAMFTRPAAQRTTPPMSGREAAARHLFGMSVKWDAAEMADFDASPILQGGWLAEADRRVAAAQSSERVVAALNGHTPEEWAALPEIARKDAREHVAWTVRA